MLCRFSTSMDLSSPFSSKNSVRLPMWRYRLWVHSGLVLRTHVVCLYSSHLILYPPNCWMEISTRRLHPPMWPSLRTLFPSTPLLPFGRAAWNLPSYCFSRNHFCFQSLMFLAIVSGFLVLFRSLGSFPSSVSGISFGSVSMFSENCFGGCDLFAAGDGRIYLGRRRRYLAFLN